MGWFDDKIRNWRFEKEMKKPYYKRDISIIYNLFIERANRQQITFTNVGSRFQKEETLSYRQSNFKFVAHASNYRLKGTFSLIVYGFVELSSVVHFEYDADLDQIVFKNSDFTPQIQWNEREMKHFFTQIKEKMLGKNAKLKAMLY